MSKPEPPTFHARLPPSLKAQLQAARGRNSLNREIIERLERSFEPDPALQLAQIIRPFLAGLDEADYARFIELAASAVAVLSSAAKPK